MFTRIIYPLFLRKKFSSRVQKFFPNVNDKNISLEFAKKIKLDLLKSDTGHKSIIFNGYYELRLTRDILRIAAKGGLLVDVGANYGYFSCLWASQNSNNKVIAFEASPMNIGPLRNNVNKNLLNNQVTVIAAAAGKEPGKLKFDLKNETHQTGWGGFTLEDNQTAVDVEVDTLDNYASRNNITAIDVLKIDTEGADTWVLYGAKKLLMEKKIKHIFFERHIGRMRRLNIDKDEAEDFLRKLDYVVERHSSFDVYAYPKKTD